MAVAVSARRPVPAIRALVPDSVTLPAEFSPVAIDVALAVDEDGTVSAPWLREVQAALAVGSVEFVRQACGMWTRWLARAEREAAGL